MIRSVVVRNIHHCMTIPMVDNPIDFKNGVAFMLTLLCAGFTLLGFARRIRTDCRAFALLLAERTNRVVYLFFEFNRTSF